MIAIPIYNKRGQRVGIFSADKAKGLGIYETFRDALANEIYCKDYKHKGWVGLDYEILQRIEELKKHFSLKKVIIRYNIANWNLEGKFISKHNFFVIEYTLEEFDEKKELTNYAKEKLGKAVEKEMRMVLREKFPCGYEYQQYEYQQELETLLFDFDFEQKLGSCLLHGKNCQKGMEKK